MSRAFRPLTSKRVLHKIKEISAPQEGQSYVINRNPRNLEKLQIAHKPTGYHLEKAGRSFWNKLEVQVSGRYVTAEVKHFENGTVISASTSEWALKKQLFKTKDTAAFINLGRVLAQRCLQSGIHELSCHIDTVSGSKMDKLLQAIKDNGVSFSESEQYVSAKPWEAYRPAKPWDLLESEPVRQ